MKVKQIFERLLKEVFNEFSDQIQIFESSFRLQKAFLHLLDMQLSSWKRCFFLEWQICVHRNLLQICIIKPLKRLI